MNERKTICLGKNAQKLLLCALPFMIFLACALTFHVARLDGTEILRQRANILLSLETLSRISFCLALGTVLADYAEKRTSDIH